MTERKVGVTDVASGAGVADFRTRERSALGCEQYLVTTREEVAAFRALGATFRTVGVASVDKPLCSLFNRTGSGKLVVIEAAVLETFLLTTSGTTRWTGAYRITTAPTDGTLLTPVAMDTAGTHEALVEFRGAASADATATALTAALVAPYGDKQGNTRSPSEIGQMLYLEQDLLDAITFGPLREGEGVVIAGVESGSTNASFLVKLAWTEYTLP